MIEKPFILQTIDYLLVPSMACGVGVEARIHRDEVDEMWMDEGFTE